jgi:hypothetical protein
MVLLPFGGRLYHSAQLDGSVVPGAFARPIRRDISHADSNAVVSSSSSTNGVGRMGTEYEVADRLALIHSELVAKNDPGLGETIEHVRNALKSIRAYNVAAEHANINRWTGWGTT